MDTDWYDTHYHVFQQALVACEPLNVVGAEILNLHNKNENPVDNFFLTEYNKTERK